MLEFIVLGEVPGTHIQITFAWFTLLLVAGLIWLDYKIHQNHRTKGSRRKSVEVIRPGRV